MKFVYLDIMKYVKGKNEKSTWLVPTEINQEEFLEAIKKAEKGPFYTVQESMARFDEWLKNRPKR